MTREGILKNAKMHFFAAMLVGWAAGVNGVEVPGGMPGFKEIMYKKDDFRVLDRWCVSDAKKSTGTTTIWFFDNPIWVMNYGGFYKKENMLALKQALMVAYIRRLFVGGRGPRSLTGPFNLEYSNYANGDFSSFHGKEYLSDYGEKVGWHEYWGMALI